MSLTSTPRTYSAGASEVLRGRLPALLAANPALIACVLGVAVLVALGASEAGFYAVGSDSRPGLGWYPAGLLLLGLLAVSLIALPTPSDVPRPVLAAIGLLGAYTAWAYLSITWADQQDVALDGAHRTAVYLLILALFSLWRTDATVAMLMLGALGLAIAGIGAVELLRADAASDPGGFFVDARLSEPAGYINANVALWTLGLWACLAPACSRELPAALRGLWLGSAGLLATLALMGQSRGWFLAVPITAVFFVAFMPGRVRALAGVVAVAAGVLAVSGPVLAVHDDFAPQRLDALLADATTAILAMTVVLAAVGFAAALLDRRVRLSARRGRLIGLATAGCVAIALAGGAVAFVATQGSPTAEASDAWEEFKDGGYAPTAGSTRLSAGGSNRYDFWSVAWDLFAESPVRGVGMENFQQDYALRGESSERPRYPHSLQLGVISQTGLIGGLLLGGALLAALIAVGARVRRAPPAQAAACIGCTAVAVYWLAHASIDWFWEFPALTGIAFAMLGLGTAAGRPDGRSSPSGARSGSGSGSGRLWVRRGAAVAVGLVGLALAVGIGRSWLAERHLATAAGTWPSDPFAAFERLEDAADLNPLSPKPHLYAAFIALRIEDQERAIAEFERARELDPRDAFTLVQLAALAAERGDDARALDLSRRAVESSPRDELAEASLEALRAGEALTPQKLQELSLNRNRRRAD